VILGGKARYDDGFIVIGTRAAIVELNLYDGNDGELYHDGL